jgi:hypothetical protein
MLSSSDFKSDKIGIIKNWLEDNQTDIVLVIGVILISLISFGLGRLSAPKNEKEPVVIENQGTSNLELGTGSALNNAAQSAIQGVAEQGGVQADPAGKQADSGQVTNSNSSQGVIVASKNGTKYHWPWCSSAKKIKPENQVWFKSEAEAKAAGYTACANFTKLAPAEYKP